MLLVCGALLASCTTSDWASGQQGEYNRYRDGRYLNPIGTQTGRLTVVAIDYSDGRPLYRAWVDITSSSSSDDTYHYRKSGLSDRFGMVTFTDVPPVVDVFIRHPRGEYGVERYPVGNVGTSEFRAWIETAFPRTVEEDR
jgi:hypothetical protein